MRKIILFLVTFFVIIQTSCSDYSSSEPTQINYDYSELWRNWISGDPCELPCLINVTPGKTSLEDAINIFSDSELILDYEYQLSRSTLKPGGFGNITINSFNEKFGFNHSIYFEYDSSVRKTINKLSSNLPQIELSFFIDHLGDPTHIFVSKEKGDENFSKHYFSLEIVWLDRGVSLTTYSDEPITLEETHYPRAIGIFSPGEEGFAIANNEVYLSKFVDWEGFKSFDYYLDKIENE